MKRKARIVNPRSLRETQVRKLGSNNPIIVLEYGLFSDNEEKKNTKKRKHKTPSRKLWIHSVTLIQILTYSIGGLSNRKARREVWNQKMDLYCLKAQRRIQNRWQNRQTMP
jgi:hypothetical protein